MMLRMTPPPPSPGLQIVKDGDWVMILVDGKIVWRGTVEDWSRAVSGR